MNWYKKAQENNIEIVDENIICPFCKEADFDLVGLKSHLEHGDCETYNIISSMDRLF
jgi:hypothetical protein